MHFTDTTKLTSQERQTETPGRIRNSAGTAEAPLAHTGNEFMIRNMNNNIQYYLLLTRLAQACCVIYTLSFIAEKLFSCYIL